jgi:hypothetical protein
MESIVALTVNGEPEFIIYFGHISRVLPFMDTPLVHADQLSTHAEQIRQCMKFKNDNFYKRHQDIPISQP